MNNKQPLFSIILTVYNQENCIEKTLLSLNNQIFKDFEIIVIDDGSNDKSLEIIKKIKEENEKIILVEHKENKSAFMARLTGVDTANGKYILFLDGDDNFFDDALAKLNNEVIEKEDFDICEFSYLLRTENKIIIPLKMDNQISRIEQFAQSELPSSSIWNKLYKAEIIKNAFTNIPIAYMNVAEDWYQNICVAIKCKKYIQKNILVYNYNNESGITNKKYNIQKNANNFISINNSLNCCRALLEKNIEETISNKILKNLETKLLDWAMVKIKYQTIESDIAKSYVLLPKYFNCELLFNDFELLYNDAKKYRYGKFSIKNFCRRIYHMLKK